MALHKLLVDEFSDDVYSLIAIHCTIEDYRLAYLLNRKLNINLERKAQDLDFKYVAASYSIYEWEDKQHRITWHLVANVCRREEDALTSSGTLFNSQNKIIRTHNLIPEFKNVNYFLKVYNDGNAINEKTLLHKMQDISQIAAVYTIDVTQLKSKDNLIFN